MLGIGVNFRFLKGFITGCVVTVLALFVTVYMLGRNAHINQQPSVAQTTKVTPPSAPTLIPPPKPISPWTYTEEIDPVTKKLVSRVEGQLVASNTVKKVVMDVVWSCPERNINSTNIKIATFLEDDGTDTALEQHPSEDVEFRFDGVSGSKSYRREYSNSVEITLARDVPYNFPKPLYKIINEFRVIKLYIVDPDFVVRIPTTAGKAAIEFSLDDAAITRLLTECGFTYGQPSVRNRSGTE